MKVLVIGDVIGDIIVVPAGAIRPNTDTSAQISHTLGGSAGNIASWAAYAGADVTFLGCVNHHDVDRVQKQFANYKVKVNLQTSSKETGTLVSIVEGSSRTMLTDRGANQDLDFEAIDNHHLENFGFVFLSGYPIFENEASAINALLDRVHDLGIQIMVDPGSAGFIKDYGIENFKLAIRHADYLLPNEDEFELLGPDTKTTIVKKGSAAVDLYQTGTLTDSFEVVSVTAIDPTGAGDSFSGTVLAHLAKGESLHHAINAGIANAAIAVMTIGARPQL